MSSDKKRTFLSNSVQNSGRDSLPKSGIGASSTNAVSDAEGHCVSPSSNQVAESVLVWTEFLQREGASLFLVTLSFSSRPDKPNSAIRRELRRIFRLLDSTFAVGDCCEDCERPTLVLLPPLTRDADLQRSECRALMAVPLAKRTVVEIATVAETSVARKGLTVSIAPVYSDQADELSVAVSQLAFLPRSDWFILPESRIGDCESSGVPMISELQLDAQRPKLLEIQRNFSRLIDRYGAALSHGQSLQVVTLGMYPATILLVVPITDLIEHTLDNHAATPAGDRLELRWSKSPRAMLRRATILIPGVGTQTTCFGDPAFVLEDIKRSFRCLVGRAAQTPGGADALARRVAPLDDMCCQAVAWRPFSIASLMSVLFG